CLRATDPWGSPSPENCTTVQTTNRAPTGPAVTFLETIKSHQYFSTSDTYRASFNVQPPVVAVDADQDPLPNTAYTWYIKNPTDPYVNVTGPLPGQSGAVIVEVTPLYAASLMRSHNA